MNFSKEEIEKLIEQYSASNDKTNWPDGEWKTEPDEEYFEYEGYKCRIIRAYTSGSLCGYVALDKTHPDYEKEYDGVDMDVHGGVTYGRVEEDGLYWIGFDCSHFQDYSPKHELIRDLSDQLLDLKKKYPSSDLWTQNRTYKNIEFVRAEIRHMVDQLKSR